MVKGFQAGRKLKPPKDGAALITVDDCGDPFVQDPIDQSKNWKAQSIGPWDENDPDRKDEEAERLVKIFG